MVVEDSSLAAGLAELATREELFAKVIDLARSRGIDISPEELEAVAGQNRRAWLERGLFQ